MNSKLATVLERFDGLTETTSGIAWQARCPAHDDTTPSLSIKFENDKILFFCHGACTQQEVMEAAGLKWQDLFLNGKPRRKISAVYDYQDDAGKLIYQIVRYEPKDFRARRPDGEGGWLNNLHGIRRVPYRLPKIITSPRVIITEGEKDADTGNDLGFAASCNPGGAGKWRDEYSEFFRDKHVRIIPDNDEPGEKHARQVACALFTIAKSIKVVRLPKGKDLTEWHDLGGKRGDLIKLINSTAFVAAEEIESWRTVDASVAAKAANISYMDSHQTWPQRPDQAFYGLAGDVVQRIEPHSEADPVAILAQFLVAFGNAIGRKARFPVEADYHYPNLFAVLIGPTSKGRKGTALGHARRLFTDACPDWDTNCVQSGLASGEGLIYAVRDPELVPGRQRKDGKVLNNDDDGRVKVGDAGVEDKRLWVVESEFAQPLKLMGREGNILSTVIRQAWDTGDLRTLTKNSPTKATGAHISIVGHITVEELRRYLSQTEQANGFGNRFLWLCSRRSKSLPDGGRVPENDLAPLAKRLAKAVTFASARREMARSNDAKKMWHEIYDELSEGKPGLLGALTGRAEAQVTRLSMVYALLDCSTTIELRHLQAALGIWKYVEASVLYTFGEPVGEAMADKIIGALKQSPGGLSRTAISNIFARHKSTAQIQNALDVLQGSGQIRREVSTTDGRSEERWIIAVGGQTVTNSA